MDYKKIICQKDPGKGNTVDNISQFHSFLSWKLMTVDYLKIHNLLPVELKNRQGTKEQLLIDKMVLNDCKNRHTNLGTVWIDCMKAYMITHSWILKSLELVQVSQNIVQFIRKSMKNWNTKLTSCGEYLAKVDVRGSIF